MGINDGKNRKITGNGDIPVFLEQLSKEIRSQVNSIFGLAELISHEEISEKTNDALIDIRRAASKALHVSEAISDLVKINNNSLAIEEKEYSFEDLVLELRTMIEQSALRKDLETVINVDPNIPYRLIGDHDRLYPMLGALRQYLCQLRVQCWLVSNQHKRILFIILRQTNGNVDDRDRKVNGVGKLVEGEFAALTASEE